MGVRTKHAYPVGRRCEHGIRDRGGGLLNVFGAAGKAGPFYERHARLFVGKGDDPVGKILVGFQSLKKSLS
jgi:hypothetical protein